MSPEQSRAARGLLDWSQSYLASRSNLGESTIRDFEKGRRVPSPNNLAAIRSAFEVAGILFVPENGEGMGVRLRKLREGDAVRMKPGTSIWGDYPDLQNVGGRIIDIVNDGTPLLRITVSYPDGELIPGADAGLFERVASAGKLD